MDKEESMTYEQLTYIISLMSALDYDFEEINKMQNKKLTKKEATYLTIELLEKLKGYCQYKADRQIEEIKKRELVESE